MSDTIILGNDPALVNMMLLAYKVASENSKDKSTQNSAVIVTPGQLVAGVNGLNSRIADKPERHERPAKYMYYEHAERNAIYGCAAQGIATQGLTMIAPWAACADCARAIIAAGITHLITHKSDAPEHNL